MYSSGLLLIAVALGFSKISQGRPSSGPLIHEACTTENWPGWNGIKHAFIFGDSYTTTGFNATVGPQPSIGNPLGNPSFPGDTASDGPNWVDYLTIQYNASLILTYNLASGGATVDSNLVTPFEPTVLSVKEQVLDEFLPVYSSSPSFAPWTSNDTLFSVFIGINDVGNSYGEGVPATTTLNNEIFAEYSGLIQTLYETGARNFLFLNVPPVDRSPLTTAQGASAVEEETADLAAFNSKVADLAASLKSNHTDANVFTFDTNSLFNEVLDNPESFPQTALYKNTTDFCFQYENGTATTTTFVASCGVPVDEYFWLNSLHPTFPMHNVLAQEVSLRLESGPNVC